MRHEHRAEPRESVKLPLQLDNGQFAVTRDISATGLFIETASPQKLGGLVNLEIDFDTPGGPMRLRAQGRIVRLESHGDRAGVGVQLVDSRLVAVE